MSMTFRRYWTKWIDATDYEPKRWVVGDATDEELKEAGWGKIRPHVAEFRVSQLYDDATQCQRARDYRDYMNKLVDAAETAYKNNHLIDVLSRKEE